MLNKKKNNKGFTLVELLVVIAIIGILAVVAVPALFKNIEKGKVADLEADISAIRSASLSYYADYSQYPTAVEASERTGETVPGNLEDELEGLSKPFGAKYSLSGTVPQNLKLTIALAQGMSSNGYNKLVKDLGSDIAVSYTHLTLPTTILV